MENKLYTRIIFAGTDCLCPNCDLKISDTKSIDLVLYRHSGETVVRKVDIPFCTYCELPLAYPKIQKKIRQENQDYYAAIIYVRKMALHSEMKKIVVTPHSPTSSVKAKKTKNLIQPPKAEVIIPVCRVTRRLRTIGVNDEVCPHCSSKLYNGQTPIPTENGNTVLHGKVCLKCDCLYFKNIDNIQELLKDNLKAKGFTLNGHEYWNYSAKANAAETEQYVKSLATTQRNNGQVLCRPEEETLSRFPSGVLLFVVKSSYSVENYIIANDIKDQDKKSNVLHYTDTFALELLTAAFKIGINQEVEFGDKRFCIKEIVYSIQKNGKNITTKLIPAEIEIRPNGGYYSSVRNNLSEEVVDLLLYSPFTGRYEITKATYNKQADFCYMDAGIFRRFVREFGNPGITLDFGGRNGFGRDWSDLQSESVLKRYGYSVSQADGLSTSFRQELLAELVDLDILQISFIVRMLVFFISSHPSHNYLRARTKWELDRDYISAYKANPKRFLIANIQ